jgi:hypothetical protein
MPISPAVKIIALLKRRAGMSMEAFVEYYETNHAPLVLRLVPYITDYRRNYVEQGSAFASMDGKEPDCDVITEAWFATEEDFAKFSEVGSRPEIREIVIRDELNFLDRGSIRMFVVRERASAIVKSDPNS